MNKKILLVVVLLLVANVVSAEERNQVRNEVRTTIIEQVKVENNDVDKEDVVNATGSKKEEVKENKGRGEERRSAVANAVKVLLSVADRDGGIGEKVREIARNHEEDSNKIEDTVNDIRNRGQFKKFLFGPDYKGISDAEDILKRHDERLAELEALLPTVKTTEDRALIGDRIAEMKMIRTELQNEIAGSEDVGFSLFGWLNKIINKK